MKNDFDRVKKYYNLPSLYFLRNLSISISRKLHHKQALLRSSHVLLHDLRSSIFADKLSQPKDLRPCIDDSVQVSRIRPPEELSWSLFAVKTFIAILGLHCNQTLSVCCLLQQESIGRTEDIPGVKTELNLVLFDEFYDVLLMTLQINLRINFQVVLGLVFFNLDPESRNIQVAILEIHDFTDVVRLEMSS